MLTDLKFTVGDCPVGESLIELSLDHFFEDEIANTLPGSRLLCPSSAKGLWLHTEQLVFHIGRAH
jgi:hypothetical protein